MLSVFDQGPFPACPAPFNLAAHVLRHADAAATKTALSLVSTSGSVDWSYGALQNAVRGTGTGLLNAGLKPGDIVLMRLGNTVDFPIAYLGAIAAGLIPVPTSSQLTASETAKMITDLQPAAVLRDPAVACVDARRHISLDDLRDMRTLPPCSFAMGDPDRLAYIVYTSGTSGKPRAVAHAHRAIWARQMMVDGWYGLRRDDRLLHAGAFNWTYTLGTGLMDPWTAGATALIPDPDTVSADIPELLAHYKASIFAAAPGVYRKILTQNLPKISTLRHGLSAGEKLSENLHAKWLSASGTELYEAYGMSECSTFISSSPAHHTHNNALGRPQPGRRIAILGPDGPVPMGDEGTIAVHRSDPGLMREYLNAPEDTNARFQGEWFVTGDQARMDPDGQIFYLGRDDDMMNAGGFRVSPLEVEAALSQHPAIAQVGVTQIEVKPDTFIVAAFFTTNEDVSIDTLQAFANANLARYKQPRAYQQLDVLPSGANGKLLRRALPTLFKG
ncbi:MAG: class I adenylate-forming enzyme family protein [Paracoccaceae bacterium]